MQITNMIRECPLFYMFAIRLSEYIAKWKMNRIKNLDDTKKREHLSKLYYEHIGEKLEWSNLETYTAKMQWVKMYDVTEIKARLSDKYVVREWVKEKIGNDYLIPLIGKWESADEIDFGKLPDKYVLKTNNGTGTNIIINGENEMDKRVIRAKLKKWMQVPWFYWGLELHYALIKPLIIAEQYIEHEGDDLQDYKFLCFDGIVYYCWVDVGRYHTHKRNVYDLNWKLQPWNQYHYGNAEETIPQPDNFDEMVRIASILCQGFSHVRVDLYNVNGRIYFGEMTFTNGCGFEEITPREYDLALGKMWKINLKG